VPRLGSDRNEAAWRDRVRQREGGDQQIRRGHRRGRLQMMLEEPDLIDADTFRQLDFFELPLWQERQLRPVVRRPER
jgi:hypothetical protein